MTGIESIAAERKRQIEAEGWTRGHDDAHERGEIAGGHHAVTVVHARHRGSPLGDAPLGEPGAHRLDLGLLSGQDLLRERGDSRIDVGLVEHELGHVDGLLVVRNHHLHEHLVRGADLDR